MYRCRHDQEEDPYASGNENRRRNRDRLNEDIERYNYLRRLSRGGSGPPFGGPLGMPGGMYGLGPSGPPPFGLGSGGPGFGPALSNFCGPPGPPRPPGFPGMFGPLLYPPPSYDDSDSDDDESPSPWYPPPPPPWYGASPLSTRRLPPRSLYGRRYGRGFGGPYGRYYMDHYDNHDYGYMPRPIFPCRGGEY